MKIVIVFKKPKRLFDNVFNIIKNITFGLIIMSFAVIAGLILLELLVRKIKPQITYTQAYNKSSGDFEYSSFAPFTLRPNIKRDKFYINSLGYRNKEFSKTKSVNEYRILFLGDSFVSSMEPDNENAPPQIVDKLLNSPGGGKKFEVINAGFHDGYSPDSYYAYLKAEGLSLEPDMVIMGIYLQNDVGDIRTNIWEKLDEKGLPVKVGSDWRRIDNQGRQFDGLPAFRYRYSYLKESHLWILFANWFERKFPDLVYTKQDAVRFDDLRNLFDLTFSSCIFLPECFPEFSPEFQKMLVLLKGTSEILKENDIKFVVVFFPSVFQLGLQGNPTVTRDNAFMLQRTIMKYFTDNQLSADFLDLTSNFITLRAVDYYLTYDTHWNFDGNWLAGKVIAEKVKEILNLLKSPIN